MPRPKDTATKALEELESLEVEVAQRAEEAGSAAQTEKAAREEVATLQGQRARLADRKPDLILYTGAPNGAIKENPLFAIDEALAKFDLDDLSLQTQHARKLLRAAQVEVEDFIAGQYPLIEKALIPEVEAATEEAAEKIAEAAQAVDRLIVWNHRFTNLAAHTPGLEGRGVRGIEHLAALKKALERAALPSPIPVKPEGWRA